MSIASRFFITLLASAAVLSPAAASAHGVHETYQGHPVEYAAAAPGYTVDREDSAVEGTTTDILYTDAAPQNWQDMLPYAAQVWGGAVPNCAAITMATFSTDVSRIGAKATLGGCNIWVNVNNFAGFYSDRDRCILIAHEYGHLLGFPHEPGGLMAEDATIYQAVVPICDALGEAEVARNRTASLAANNARVLPDRTLKKLTFKRAARIVNEWYDGKWTVTSCKRAKRYVVDCKGSRGTRRHLFTVQISADGYNTAIA